mmetsp:Transcript_14393/g.26502  ORF Transcript_14393/g.26502 Transcript_14393/m.26502 type:complete len:145 (-) Transcript_14393:24-458(-)
MDQSVLVGNLTKDNRLHGLPNGLHAQTTARPLLPPAPPETPHKPSSILDFGPSSNRPRHQFIWGTPMIAMMALAWEGCNNMSCDVQSTLQESATGKHHWQRLWFTAATCRGFGLGSMLHPAQCLAPYRSKSALIAKPSRGLTIG